MLIVCIQNVINAVSGLASTLITNAGGIITVPVIGVYSLADQQAVFIALSQVRSSHLQNEKDFGSI